MDSIPKEIELTEEQLSELIQRLDENRLRQEDREMIKGLLRAHAWLAKKLQEKELTYKSLLRSLYGKRTESSRNILKNVEKDASTQSAERPPPAEKSSRQSSGHGRRAASEYPAARRIVCTHPEIRPGMTCPECRRGPVYKLEDPGVFLRFKARPPIDGTVFLRERLRCSSCGCVLTAPLPKGVPSVTWDESAKSMAAVLRYGAGMPHHRIEKLQGQLGIPISDATLFTLSEQVADAGLSVYRLLLNMAPQGGLFHADDTGARILALMSQPPPKDRTGIFTTAVISKVQEHEICLFFTGRKHAGENLTEILRQRQRQCDRPILMADAASRNFPKTLDAILAKCLTHARRHFVDVYEGFPQEVTHVIQELAIVYRNDHEAHQLELSPLERLAFHQERSAPVMERLQKWAQALIDEKKVEPNSSLGKAIQYLENHWDGLTRFLHIPGAPISNDIAERLLKRAVLHRKNSMFYLTEHGAAVGDILMSLIQTAVKAGANPFDYLTQLQRHRSEAHARADLWLPWNYTATLAAIQIRAKPAA